MRRSGKPFDCPVCGETVPPNAQSCPECGACEKSGWSDDLTASELDLPEEDFDYTKFSESEFGQRRVRKPAVGWLWWATAAALVAWMIWSIVPR